MESSFVDYRDRSNAESESEAEIIDDSLVEESFSAKKKLPVKNQTVFVAESEDSVSEDEEENIQGLSKSVTRRSSAVQPNIVLSSDDDTSKRGSIRMQSDKSGNHLVITSSDEEEMSPEMVPKRRPPIKATQRLSESFIGKKTKKRMMILDSDTDNSLIAEQERRGKLVCLKDTPVKVESDKINIKHVANLSFEENNKSDHDDHESRDTSDQDADVSDPNDTDSEDEDANPNDDDLDKIRKNNESAASNTKSSNPENCSSAAEVSEVQNEDDDDGFDEDKLVMSRATRMSIMGFLPKENESDESDYIQSDDTKHTSRGSLTNSVSDLPEMGTEAPEISAANTNKERTPEKVADTSRLTCSPFTSPLQDITSEINNSVRKSLNSDREHRKPDVSISLIEGNAYKAKSPAKLKCIKSEFTEKVIDDDVTIIDRSPEIIALSSDDEDVITVENKSPKKKSPRKSKVKTEESVARLDSNIKQYLVPPSYPNQVKYVKKHVREHELSKLEGLREDLRNMKHLVEHMELDSLPDGGARLLQRITEVEEQVRAQGDTVANMVVVPDEPTAEDIAKDGFGATDKAPSWEEIQKASNAVQPRMFGKHAMATHMAERNLIMERLRDLHESLGSRPPEHERAKPPRDIATKLMPHQLHALAWLRWRETQRPPGGILADDMGLGKTITMISLVAHDKEHSIDHDDDEDDDRYPNKNRGIRGGTLVVCPASLVQQWAGEVRAHAAPRALAVATHHGAARAQHAAQLATSDLVITTYNILLRETEKNGVLTRVQWRRVILDEAHVVRNHKSATAGAVCGLRARRRWALTGTPLHNRDLDLFALLKFLRCTPFDDLAMWKKWIDNKSLGGEERLSMMMRCLMLRRTKAQLQAAGQLDCLPPRTLHDRHVTLGKDEMNVYQKVLVSSKTLFAQYLQQRAEKQNAGFSRSEQDKAYALHKKMVALQGVKPVKSHEILVLLLRLRQMCCHCGLVAAMLSDGADGVEEDPADRDLLAELDKLTIEEDRAKRKSGVRELEGAGDSGGEGEGEVAGATVAEAIRSVLSPGNPVFSLERPSAKIAAVMDCLNTNVFPNEGEKAVVVSQWTSVLRLVERGLRAGGVRAVTLSGAVPVPARAALVDRLNDPRSDVRVMLLSLCAGGVGLNLVGASHLLLLDPHWNPQLEQQAQDRVYRVGQARPVHVYRFMCVDTVEQSIRALQAAKLARADSVLTGARQAAASALSIDDLKILFNMGPADGQS